MTLSVKPGPCVLISGHDMNDMEALLKATAGKGINGTRGAARALA